MFGVEFVESPEFPGFELLEPYTGCGVTDYYYNRITGEALITWDGDYRVVEPSRAMEVLGWRAEVIQECLRLEKPWDEVFSYEDCNKI
jgi:hypothetical protein